MAYVYLIRCQEYHKIGVATDIQDRLINLSTGNPFPLEVVAYYDFENSDVVEKNLHRHFKKYHHRNEWFLLDNAEGEFRRICESKGITEAFQWDYATMFSAGWRMEKQSGGNSWNWRRGWALTRETKYGGTLSSLPYPINEMRQRYLVVVPSGIVADE